jgi:lipoprotein-anchoring transpeptidase ErfK/SrfK
VRGRAVLLPLALILAIAAACSGRGEPAAAPAPPEPEPASVLDPTLKILEQKLPPPAEDEPVTASDHACAAGQVKSMRTARKAYAAVVRSQATAYARPGNGRLMTFGRLNANGVPTVFGVLAAVVDRECKPRWYKVQLPARPNGLVGFVRAKAVKLGLVTTRISVDLSERRLEVFRDGKLVLRSAAAIGASITPTPTGHYYVNQRLVAPDPWGPFGPAAIGISAFSPVLQDWAQGGPIAIHGTNDPSSIGKPASHGCIRIGNDSITWLFRSVPLGAPVTITA